MRWPALVSLASALLLPSPYVLAAQVEPQCGAIAGNPELAIEVCTRLIEIPVLERPELAKAHHARGVEWATLGRHDQAVADYDKALELDADVAGARHNRALSLAELGQHERAVADWTAALEEDPRGTRAYLGRAADYTALGDYARALADYEALIRLQPQSGDGYFGRGRVRFYSEDYLQAASDFIRAHRLDPSLYTAVWIYLARKRADIPGEKTLAVEAGTAGAGAWPSPLIGLFLGNASPAAVETAASEGAPMRVREQRCEAAFYLSQWHLTRGERQRAETLLREAATNCPRTFVEQEAAIAELRRLKVPLP